MGRRHGVTRMPSDPRQVDRDAAPAELVVARAAQPADVNRLVAAAVRLRSAVLAPPARMRP